MTCDDRGPDLMAHLLGQLDADEARELTAHLDGCETCQGEAARLAEVHAATAEAAQIEPGAESRERLLATVREEAVSRRRHAEAVAAASTDACDGFGAEAVSLALGQLEGAERTRVEDHVATCEPCQADFADTRRWSGAARTSVDLTPAPETLARLLDRIEDEEREAAAETDLPDVPEPVRRVRTPPRILAWLIPAAMAAAMLVAVSLTPDQAPPHGAVVQSGSGVLYGSGESVHAAATLDASHGRFTLGIGDEMHAGGSPFRLGVAFDENADPKQALGGETKGVARFVLAPGARVRRLALTRFELRAGQVEVSAGPVSPALEIGRGDLYARVRGTRFVASVAEERLVVVVLRGKVEIGREGGESRVLEAGEQGLVDAGRLLVRQADTRVRGDAFLTPRARLSGPESVKRGAGIALAAELGLGEGGPVTIAGFDPSLPLFVVRLKKRPDGPERSVTIVRSMIAGDSGGEAPGARTVRLADGKPYRLRFTLPGKDLEPGRWEARLRYMSYRAASQGAEWLGVVDSPALEFEVHQQE